MNTSIGNNSTENILNKLRMKIEMIKQKKYVYLKNKKQSTKVLNKPSYGQCYSKKKENDNIKSQHNMFVKKYDPEAMAVENCFRKSMKLVAQNNKMKQLKKHSQHSFVSSSNDLKYTMGKSSSENINPLKEIQMFTITDEYSTNALPFFPANINNNCKPENKSFKDKKFAHDKTHNSKSMINKTKERNTIDKRKSDKIITEGSMNCRVTALSKKNLSNKILKEGDYQNADTSFKSPSPSLKFAEDSQISYIQMENRKFDFAPLQSSTPSHETLTDGINIKDKKINSDLNSHIFINGKYNSNNIPNRNLFRDIHISDEITEIREEPSEPIIPVLDFTEEPVDYVLPNLHLKESLWEMSKEEKEKLVSEGIIKGGRWSKAENALLKRNYSDFTSKYKINDARLLFGIGVKSSLNKKEHHQMQQFLKAKHFLVRLGKDLNNRTLRQIYLYAKFCFDPIKKKKKLSTSDILLILQLQKKYGNRWLLISKKTGISRYQCSDYYYQYAQNFSFGKWADIEVEKLISAIKKVSNLSDLSNKDLKGISWTKVANLVGSRNREQCCKKWYLSLVKEQNPIKYQKWDKKCSIKFISLLKNDYYVDDADINWQKLLIYFKNVSPSIFYLKKKWMALKANVPKNIKSNYCDIINYLFKKYCSEIES